MTTNAKSTAGKARRHAAAPAKKRRNLLSSLGLDRVDYKDTSTLRQFISERGKIRSRTVTGLTVQQQRQVARAIENAREMALLPYPGQERQNQRPAEAALDAAAAD